MSMKIVTPDDFPVVLTGSPAERRLRALGDVTVYTERGAEQETELVRRIGAADIVVSLRAYTRISESVLTACPSVKMISIWGTGTDNVDLAACDRRGIAVAHTPGVNAHAVAEHTLALILAVTRRIPSLDRDVRNGQWPRGLLVQLEGKTLGIVGLGAIGRRVAALAAPFGASLLASTWGVDAGRAAAVGARHASIETLLQESDIVSLHLRLSAETEAVINRERLALMKPGAFLVNTARGRLVDREALVDALQHGRLAGAALDVFHEEPIAASDPLLTLPNVILTPHNAGMTQEVIDVGLLQTVENVQRFLNGDARS
ncbi:MAG TPA: phosphoglycerate dehydrogenase [Blastocatellia bacterium]|nr:phosphoglycerate dehydrogenase [Blastocatellia bacterium]